MIKILIVVGTWSNARDKVVNEGSDPNIQSFIEEIRQFSLERTEEISLDIHTGGSLGQLETLAEESVDQDFTFWLPKVVPVTQEDQEKMSLFPASRHILFKDNILSDQEIIKIIQIVSKYGLVK